MSSKLIIFGAGGFGRELAAMLQYSALAEEYELVGFADDGLEPGSLINGLKVLGNTKYLLHRTDKTAVVMGIGRSRPRKQLVEKLMANTNLIWPNIIHPSARLHDKNNIQMGHGNVICDGNILTTNIKLGDFNVINLSCTLGHDTILGSYCSLMPSVNVSGGTVLEDEVYVGTGAKLIKATTLGQGCTVGAGAVVNRDVNPGITVKGVPAK